MKSQKLKKVLAALCFFGIAFGGTTALACDGGDKEKDDEQSIVACGDKDKEKDEDTDRSLTACGDKDKEKDEGEDRSIIAGSDCNCDCDCDKCGGRDKSSVQFG